LELKYWKIIANLAELQRTMKRYQAGGTASAHHADFGDVSSDAEWALAEFEIPRWLETEGFMVRAMCLILLSAFVEKCLIELTDYLAPSKAPRCKRKPGETEIGALMRHLRQTCVLDFEEPESSQAIREKCRRIRNDFAHGRWDAVKVSIPDDGSSSEVIDPQTGYRRLFIRATIKDNPYLSNTEYARSLEALPSATRKALLEGRWDVFEGAVFSEWEYQKHTVEPFEVPAGWEMWRACDDGYAAPAAVLWLAHDKIYDRVYVVDEIYQRGLSPEELAYAVLKKDAAFERQLSGVIDGAAFAEIGLGAEGGNGSRGHIMNAHGCRWQPSEKGAGSRIHGISVIYQRLALKKDGFGGLVCLGIAATSFVRYQR
jgi:hypothetical protein